MNDDIVDAQSPISSVFSHISKIKLDIQRAINGNSMAAF